MCLRRVFPKLTAIGYAPLATQPAKEQSQRVLMAMQASKIVAYRELAEQVYGQKITANSSVSDWMLTDDNVKSVGFWRDPWGAGR